MTESSRTQWRGLLIKLIAYYAILLCALIVILYFFPQLEPYVPVGGLDQFQTTRSFSEVVSTYREEIEDDEVFRGIARLASAAQMSLAIVLTLLVMVPVSWVHHATHQDKRDRTVLETLFVLPIVITAVVLLIQNSIALAFGLAGIVAGVQYRNRLKLPIDAAYLFAAIAIGIASGIKAVGVGIIMSFWFCVTVVGIRLFNVAGFNSPEETISPDENPD